jgi:deoxycytidine triphosphate deaminase
VSPAVSVVSGKEVAACCKSFVKINPNGVDLAPTQASELPADLTIVLHGDKRGYLDSRGELSTQKTDVLPDAEGFYNFEKGMMYELRFPEVTIPATCTGFAFPRSSVNRLGIIKLESAVFDSGYHGEPTQVIFTPIAAKVHKGEALIQLVFLRNEKAAESLYSGFYQHEKGS